MKHGGERQCGNSGVSRAQDDIISVHTGINAYQNVLTDLHKKTPERPLQILDFGTGRSGFGRALMQEALRSASIRGSLHLLDRPEVVIGGMKYNEERILSIRDATYDSMDLVNLSFVFSHMSDDECAEILGVMRGYFPSAIVTICEYTLAERTRDEIVTLFATCKRERPCLEKGEDELLKTHGRFSPEILTELGCDNGWIPRETLPIGRHKHFLMCEPA